MVEYSLSLDSVFGALSDPTRRDILRRLAGKQMTIGEIGKPYKMSFAAVSKHLAVMERAKLIIKKKEGRTQLVEINPASLKVAEEYLEWYRRLWNTRLDSLEEYLKREVKE